jgi:hypothetical protein
MNDENGVAMDAATDAAVEAMMGDIEGSPEPVATPPAAAPTPPNTPDQPAVEESFTGIDPATLKGEAAELYKQMQADYTVKTQEIAAYRDLGYDPETLQQAVDFTSRLTSDPNYAAEVVEELYELVKESGLDPFEGKFAEALAPVVDEGLNPAATEGNEDLFGDGVNPEVQAQLTQLTNQISQMKQVDGERQEELEVQQLQIHLDKQEAHLISENPAYTDEDISMIHRIAWSTEGDLIAADELYQHTILNSSERYLDSKASSDGQPAAIPAGGSAEVPKDYESINDPELDAQALLLLTQALEAGGN